ncbi:MAG: hypothetical protein P8J27_10190 [Mariniblastus sp.]|nr:hypothetical protein [Mariniblastus sp.]
MKLKRHNFRGHSRSGITLLFVVSMIVLFLLMGTAFVVVSNDYFRSARKRSVKHIYATDRSALIERAFYDLFRGPELSDRNSPLRGHSLLADIYGYGVAGTIQSASADSSEHFIELTLNSDLKKLIDGSIYTPEPIPGLLTGQVISVTTGAARGLSARIIDHQVNTAGTVHSFVILPSRIENGFKISNAGLMVNSQIIINGRPFAGTGAGHYNPFTKRNDAALSAAALMPNQKGRTLDQLIGKSGPGYFSLSTSFGNQPNSMGPNESYDTYDYQNMFLAALMPDGNVLHPSFHRDEVAASGSRGDFRAFKKGGPGNNGIMVDNNNDGRPEGIWMDTGLPLQIRPDGSCIKPLVSYTVVDMGGKLNVNAHGSLLKEGSHGMTEIQFLGNTTGSRGQGYGPPEINLSAVTPAWSSLLEGSAETPGRYGVDGRPGQPNVRDDWSTYKLFGYPDDSFGKLIPGTVDRLYGSAMDVHGRFAFGYPQIFDVADNAFPIGLPVANVGFSLLANEIADSPYEMTFVDSQFFGPGERGFDSPFQPEELEAVLRRNDPDARLLPARLKDLGAFGTGTTGHSITTDSFEVPTTFENLPEKLYRILKKDTGVDGIPRDTANRESVIRSTLKKLLPAEVFRGLPMNVNREFGDGIDNNGNSVVDEIGETDFITHPMGRQFEFDHDNDGSVGGDLDTYLSRANFARHLYVMTLLSTERVDRNGDGRISISDWYDFNDDGTTNNDDLLDYRRVIAQWAVNVVDFRDRDSIMTPFEVDLNPWNGWDVDGDVTTTESIQEGTPKRELRYLFWGAERPELLISETMVTHDRRTQDLEIESVADGETATRVGDADEPDTDFDSHLVPKVSAFFELYNPWVMNDANQVRPAELYDQELAGVDLQRTSPDGSSPVWRLVVTDHDQRDLDPDDRINNPSDESPTPIRRIYFAKPSFSVDSGPEVYYPEDDIQADSVGPGRYAVVGTQGKKVGNRYDTYFGRRLTPEALEPEELHDQTRRISLDPTNGELQLLQWDQINNELELTTRKVAVLPIGLNGGGWYRELGVSDPIDGYYAVEGVGGITADVLEVEDGLKFSEDTTTGEPLDYAFDHPVDWVVDSNHYDNFLKHDGLRPGYRTVHLQRLANPLIRFNADTNPYRTIDSSSLDLFAFNGAETVVDPNNVPDVMRFGSYERRGDVDSERGQVEGRHRMLFKNDREGRVNATNTQEVEELDCLTADAHILSRNFLDSLGGLNQAYREAFPDAPRPFGWLTWNNRPFASQLELANVPFCSNYWITRLFDTAAEDSRNVYRPPSEIHELTGARSYSGQYPHLLNFYADEVEGENYSASLHHVFDYLEVPSRFVGTESYVNPITFANSTHSVSFGLAAPFDTISNYRYPGKVNINTITDFRVWNGLMGYYSSGTLDNVKFEAWEESRDGTGAYKFGNPYRPAHANNLVPPGAGPVVDPVECGLFRKKDGAEKPLFDFDPDPAADVFYSDRAPYFRNDMRQRLGNLVTSRSSVFAVWVTIGYFEVNSDGSLKPGASRAGIEAGADEGTLSRHRGFFLVDRSIPVAFEPGKNHNVERAVLVKSIIE